MLFFSLLFFCLSVFSTSLLTGLGDKDLINKTIDVGSQSYNFQIGETTAQNDDRQVFEWPTGAKQSVGPVWTMLALTNESNYTVPTWSLESHCGYWEQMCGDHCDLVGNCTVNNTKGGILNVITMEFENWCHQITKKTEMRLKQYKLQPYHYFALTTWGGYLAPAGSFDSPGWTISDSLDLLDFSKNALLKKCNMKDFPLANFSVTEKNGFLSDDHVAHLAKAPTFKADYNNTNCWDNLPNTIPIEIKDRESRFCISFNKRKQMDTNGKVIKQVPGPILKEYFFPDSEELAEIGTVEKAFLLLEEEKELQLRDKPGIKTSETDSKAELPEPPAAAEFLLGKRVLFVPSFVLFKNRFSLGITLQARSFSKKLASKS